MAKQSGGNAKIVLNKKPNKRRANKGASPKQRRQTFFTGGKCR